MASPKENCIFCEIVNKNAPETKIVFENETVLVFRDIRPASDFHFLAVPKIHLANCKSLKPEHRPLIQDMQSALKETLQKEGVELTDTQIGFHYPPFCSIHHLHMHGIGPASKMGFLSRWIFKPLNVWFCTPEYISSNIKSECKLVN